MNEENKNSVAAPENNSDKKNARGAKEKKTKKNTGIKTFFKSRKAKKGTVAAAITSLFVIAVIIVNIITGLLVDRFPNLNIDFTANNSFALQADTIDYVSHLEKEAVLYVLMDEDEMENQGTYFIQANRLLDKIKAESNGKIKIEYIDFTKNPAFTEKYKDIDWGESASTYFMLVTCADNYKMLDVKDCFEYDQNAYASEGMYKFTGTIIEQAVVKALLNVTTDDKTVVNLITGNNSQDSSGIVKLLNDNAYVVNEINLVNQEIEKDAEVLMLYAPSVDLDEDAADKISSWLENNGKYGRSLIYIPPVQTVDAPNISHLLSSWGMEIGGMAYETNGYYLVQSDNPFAFLTSYGDYFTEGLKNKNIPVVTFDAHSVIIKDSEMAHSILNGSEDSGILPENRSKDFTFGDGISGTPVSVAAEGLKTNDENQSSRVIVYGSYAMFASEIMKYNSFNNSAFFMNVINTITDNDDSGIVIESKSLDSAELGVTDTNTKNTMFVIFVVIVPLVILIIGLVTWIRRRNK